MKCIFVLLASLLYCMDLFSQTREIQISPGRWSIEVSMPDTANRYFLSKHDSLETITIVYKEKEPYMVFMRQITPVRDRKHFDLTLAGDWYYLTGKYGKIQYFSPKEIDEIPWPENGKTITLTGITYNGDSVFCHGEWTQPGVKGFNPDWTVGGPAKYDGDISALAAEIADRFAAERPRTVVDSALVFEAKIGKERRLAHLVLALGRKSVFSDIAMKVLLNKDEEGASRLPQAEWSPAHTDSGVRLYSFRFRIFVRLNSDGTVTIGTPSRLRTFAEG
ncbi:hypothetical protein [Sphingobacterium sp. SYP-B4668]|uniref:hypothetical protein n=1 Tax=Sphingobacterium sp. SYP-B4668 TaxID=2996035 RepID=UPI0022DD2442|nr:hypothetical protein [Sphingobacterium sp. SYP-B4668]